MHIPIVNKSSHNLPEYQTEGAAGLDLCANIENEITLSPRQRLLIPTGLFMEIPMGYEAQIRPRSGLAYKHGITVLNSPGTIDSDYRGEIKVLLINHSNTDFVIQNGERIAQLVVAKHERVTWVQTEELANSIRNESGFGSTGKA